MSTISKSLLLFALNWADAQLTILWIRMDVATEGNALMAFLLEFGEAPFMGFKLLVGAFAAYVLYRFANRSIAKRGMKIVLSLYVALMAIHTATGLSALGWHGPETAVAYIGQLQHVVFAFLS